MHCYLAAKESNYNLLQRLGAYRVVFVNKHAICLLQSKLVISASVNSTLLINTVKSVCRLQ